MEFRHLSDLRKGSGWMALERGPLRRSARKRADGRQVFPALGAWGQQPFAGQPKAVAALTLASALAMPRLFPLELTRQRDIVR